VAELAQDDEVDLALLARWKAGDNRSGSALVKRHFHMLHRFFASKASGQSEDLIQQTFVACVESKHAFRAESSFRAFLLGLARFQLYTYYRRRARTQQLDFTTASVRDLGTSPTGLLAEREEHLLLLRALQTVPLDQQIALELTYWEGLSAADIGRVLEIPENTVYSRVRRAKAHLRTALGELCQHNDERLAAYKLLVAAED
jgi:RNA polymerase sigma factor (sigma-70 family)